MSQAVLAEMWPCHIVTPLTTDLFDRVAIETTQSSSPDQLSISSLMPLFSFWSYHNYPPWQCLVLPAQSRRSFPAPALLSSLGCRQRDLRGKLSRCNILLFVSIIFVFFHDHFLGDIKISIPAPQQLFCYALRISLSVLIREILNYSCGSLPFTVLWYDLKNFPFENSLKSEMHFFLPY